MILKSNDIILFEGDSVTDCGRNRSDTFGLMGYTRFIGDYISKEYRDKNITCYNRGISGNRTSDLVKRLDLDLTEVKPTVVSILIGINDTWRRYDSCEATETEKFEKNLRGIILSSLAATKRIVLMEPFLIPSDPEKEVFREDLDPKIMAGRKLALEYKLEYIPLDGILWENSLRLGANELSTDGIHPTLKGHHVIANEWLKRMEF